MASGSGNLLKMKQKVEIQPPPELQPSKEDELEILPVHAERNDLAGRVEFRCPPGKSLRESLVVLGRMLQHGIFVEKCGDESGAMKSDA